ncbi:MAG: lysylphosphatidylglycerol synthase transmembrane domain-containing protein [Planctomycetota bacterium]
MKSGRARWILTSLRYGLCVAAIWYLIMVVPWNDHVTLSDTAKTRVRLIEQRGDEYVIFRDGRQEVIPASGVFQIEDGDHLLPQIELGIPSVVKGTDKLWAIWALLLFVPVPILAAIRLVWMLRIQEVHLSLWQSIKLTFAGNFFNFALPGMTGGDLIKAYYITRFTHRKTEAVTTVFLDRVVGLSSLVLMAGAMIFLTRDPSQFGQMVILLGVVFGGLAVAGVLVFSQRVRRILRLGRLIDLLPMSDQLHRIGGATLAVRHNKALVTLSLLVTFLLQTIVIISASVMAMKALGMEGRFTHYFIYIAIGFLISAVPISPPQAFGVMEFFYIQFFTYGGQNSASQAVALALAVRLIQLFWSLPGVLVPLLGAHLPARAELEALEKNNGDATTPAGNGEHNSNEPQPAASGQ